MAKTGDQFAMPDGSIYEVTAATAESSGEFVEMIFTLPPGPLAPPPHVHPRPVESYEVIEGTFDHMVDGDWRTLRKGESASVPAGRLCCLYRAQPAGRCLHFRWRRACLRLLRPCLRSDKPRQ
jgi:hypothetical protein